MKNSIGEKIRNFRKRAGLSQFDLEIQIGASPGSISRVENGQINPTKETIKKISASLGLKAHELADLFEIDTSGFTRMITLAQKVSSNLDLDNLLQDSVDDIVKDLDLFGCLLFLCDDKFVYAKTLSNTWYSRMVNKILPKPLNTLKTPLSNTDNFTVRTVLERESQFSYFMKDFSRNVIPDVIVDAIQRFNNTTAMITFPLITNSNVIGVIAYSKNNGKDFNQEYDILKSFSDHVAVAINNAQKFLYVKQSLQK